MQRLISHIKHRYLIYLFLLMILIGFYYYFESPIDYGLTEEEKSISLSKGKSVFYKNCANCHMGQTEAPSLQDIKNEYSARQLRKILSNHPNEITPFTGNEIEKRDLIVFLIEKQT